MENNQKNDKLILVIYVGVAGMEMELIPDYMNKVSTRLTPHNIDGEIIFIPTLSSYDTRVECINPAYITDIELINKNTNLLSQLNIELNNQLNILKNSNDNGKQD